MFFEQSHVRNLCSVMNNTRWKVLREAVLNDLPFPPPYQIKGILTENPFPETFKKDVRYFGDWREGFFPFYSIEWIRIRPRYIKYQGRLLPPRTIDIEEKFVSLLKRIKVPYLNEKETVVIYGYTDKTALLQYWNRSH